MHIENAFMPCFHEPWREEEHPAEAGNDPVRRESQLMHRIINFPIIFLPFLLAGRSFSEGWPFLFFDNFDRQSCRPRLRYTPPIFPVGNESHAPCRQAPVVHSINDSLERSTARWGEEDENPASILPLNNPRSEERR